MLFQVDNTPFFAWNLALGDVVAADPEEGVWRFRQVVRRIVWGISDGREAARSVDEWLSGGAASLPTRGKDASFG